jgi:hypothetical protein
MSIEGLMKSLELVVDGAAPDSIGLATGTLLV